MLKKLCFLLASIVVISGVAVASNLEVGDTMPGLDGTLIDDSADYLGDPLDIQTYLDDGKAVVVSHWKQS